MKIDSSYQSPVAQAAARSQPKAAPPSPAATTEAVSLSSLAGVLQGNEKPPVNPGRIQEIKDAIAQGRFKINPEAIADRLIETARDMVNTQRRN